MPARQIESIASYVPALVIRRIAGGAGLIVTEITETFDTVVLFADISGFTALSEKLAATGAVGMEELSNVISDYFGCLTEVIVNHGGDIVKFAGDAILALWPATADEPLAVVTRRATQCAIEMQAAIRNFSRNASSPLELKVALGAGPAICMHVGGVYGRWELMIAGAPFLQVGRADHHAMPGDVVVSREAMSLLDEAGEGSPTEDGTVLVKHLQSKLPAKELSLPPLSTPETQLLLPYVPAAVKARLGAGDTSWVAELRRVTVLFVNLPSVTHATSLEEAQRLMHNLQTTLYQFEGSVNKLSVDDKGVTLIGVMGLPPLAHEDDPQRGLLAALELHATLKQLGLKTAIGVTTGRAYCGVVGSSRRCEYTIMGDVVNLAARLMQAAPDSILCDAPTHDAAKAAFAFEILEPATIKGKAQKVQIFRPLHPHSNGAGRAQSAYALVGRSSELAKLSAKMASPAAGATRFSAVVMVEGEAGIGKSRLVEEIETKAQSGGLHFLAGAADSIKSATPYHAWRSVFSALLGLDQISDAQARRDHVLDLLAPVPKLLRLAPLLNPLIQIDLPESELTKQITGDLRFENTKDLLLGILQHFMGSKPLLVTIEDAHWMDSASWVVALLFAREMKSMLLVLVLRPLAGSVPNEYQQLLQTPYAEKITLSHFSPEEAISLACDRLDVDTLSAPVAHLIVEKAGGNPFFIVELAYALRDAGHLIIEKRKCSLKSGLDLSTISIPDTAEGVVAERIDRLTPDQQYLLKVASVVGRTFPERLMLDVQPEGANPQKVVEDLGGLTAVALTKDETTALDNQYIFKQIITQQVSYNLLLFSQRREWHKVIAEWHERVYAADLGQIYAILAHHYIKAEINTKSLQYLELAGIRALTNFANEEAVVFFNQALAIDKTSPGLVDSSRRARWLLKLGHAFYALGRLRESREHINDALTLLGRPPPGAPWQHVISLLKESLVQAAHRLWPRWFVGETGPQSDLLLEMAQGNERLAQIYYIENAKAESMNAAVAGLNLAETAGPSPELVRSYSNVTLTTALVPAYWLSARYEKLALSTGAKVGHIPSLAYAHEIIGLYHAGAGHWREADAYLLKSVELAESIGDHRRLEEAKFVSAINLHRHGQLLEARKRYEELYMLGSRRGILQVRLWGLTGQVALSLSLGGDANATQLLEELLSESDQPSTLLSRADAILAYGIMAQAYLRAGDLRQSRRAAERVITQMHQSETVSYYLLAGYHGLGEVLTSLFAKPLTQGSSKERLTLLSVLSRFRSFARMYPTARPMYFIWRGVYARTAGRDGEAQRMFGKSLVWARRLDMSFALAIAHRETSKIFPAMSSARLSHIAQARALFEKCGALRDMEQLDHM